MMKFPFRALPIAIAALCASPLAYAQQYPSGWIDANTTASPAAPRASAPSAWLDRWCSSTQFQFPMRGASNWGCIDGTNLNALAGQTGAAGKVPFFTALGTLSLFDSTSFGRSISNAADASALRTLAGIVVPAARTSSLLNIDQITTHGDSIYTVLSTDRVVATSAAFTASRTWTLPAASAVNPGQSLLVADLAAGVTASNTLVIARAGSDTINGAGTSVTITAANGAYYLVSDGVSKWTAQSMGAATGGGVTSVTCGTGMTGGTITTSGTCATDYATKSDQQTGTSTVKEINPAHQQDHDSAVKAWFVMSGTPTIAASYNVASAALVSTGRYTITFTTAFASANYSCTLTTENSAFNAGTIPLILSKTASVLTVQTIVTDQSAGGFVALHGHCFGRQ